MDRLIVDAHVHILPQRVQDNLDLICRGEPWFAACHKPGTRMATADSLVAAMDRGGVERAICFTWPFEDAALCAEANDYVAASQGRFPDRLVGFGVVNPGTPEAAPEVVRCARLGLRGIGELNANAQGWSLEEPAIRAAVDASVRAGLPWTLHCSEPVGHEYVGKGTATPNRVADFATRHDQLTLICAHLGGGLPLYAHVPEVKQLCARLYFDTAAQPFIYTSSVYGAILQLVGPERLLLGTDHPLLDIDRYLSAFEDAGIGGAERALICGGSAAQLLRL